jgi:enamine deaminase RidA (YjgF/YER057c/UK114 family)
MTVAPSDTPIRRFNVAARYSDMAVYGGVAYLAGQVPTDSAAPMASQVTQVLEQIDRLLEAGGSNRGRILMATVYLPDLADYDEMNRVWEAWLAGYPAPPRATVQARLANPAWKIEIVVTAASAGIAKEPSAA